MANVRQFSFSSGEISPSLHARADLVKHATGLRTCRNFMVMRHGGVTTRPGTGFVAEVEDSSKAVKLIPFIFNSAQTYVLEFGDLYMRVHRNGAQLTETAQNITGATQANPCVITIAGHGYSNGDEVFITGVEGMIEINGRNFKVSGVTANTFKLQALNAAGYTAYTSGGTAAKVYEITTPYAVADLPELQHIQSADIVTLVHPSYAPRELARTGHTSWTFTSITFGPDISPPANVVSDAAGAGQTYVVTSVDAETGEESLSSADVTSTTKTSTLSWDAATNATHYNVYRLSNGVYGWIGLTGTTSFKDADYSPDPFDEPPLDRQPFGSTGNYPSTVAYYQQRLCMASTDNNPERVWTSKTALAKNFMISTPLQGDDAVTFSLVGRQVNEVRHLLDIGSLVVFTSSGEWAVQGDAAGILLPAEVNPKQYTSNGSTSTLPPLNVGGNALYVQARGSVIRDLAYDFQSDGYNGNELSIFSAHLFDNYTLSDWAYQQIPHSVVWVVRSDGILLGLTYIREHQVFGWHRHDFDGTVENVAVVPEGTEDVLYLVIKRTVDSKTVRYIERMKTRQLNDIIDYVGMDSSLTYDGRHTGSTTMTLTLDSGTSWTYDEDLILTADVSAFSSGDVGNEIFLTGSDETVIRCEITAYTSGTVVTVRPHKTVPSGMRSTEIATWSKAVDVVAGLNHLEGKSVSIFADGFVVASPNNEAYNTITVSGGSVTLDKPYAVIHVGLPVTADMETLDIDTPQGPSLADKKKKVNRLTMYLESSRGVWAGSDSSNLRELKIRDDEGYDDPVDLATGIVEINIKPEWNSSGKVLIRQIDPVPLSVLAVVPSGYIGGA